MPSFNCSCNDVIATNATLVQLRTRLMIRLGYSALAATPPPGMAALLDDFLRSAQEFLYRKYKALETERIYTWPMVVNERFYGIASNVEIPPCTKRLDAYNITWVGVEDLNGRWYELIGGIPPSFYTASNYQGLPSHYEVRQCVEVFPAPAAAYTLRVKGRFGLLPFAVDADVSTLNSELVFLWALANAKNHYGSSDADDVATQAQAFIADLVAGSHGTRRYIPGSAQLPSAARPILLPLP